MPETMITIDRDQRDGLYELVRNHLGCIEDFWVALERTRNFATVERLGLEIAEDLRLLEDLGWSDDEGREGVDLTMPRHDLMELLQRLHDEAAQVLIEHGTEAASRGAAAETNQRFQLGYEACERVLADLDPRTG
jgi:hypothetical protein